MNPRANSRSTANASIEDVARAANVSISTVSRVFNNSALVNENTRRRVESAIRRLGYRPNAFARGLMLRRSDIIGLVLPDIHGEFYSEIIRGATRKAREFGYNLVVASTGDSDDSQSILSTFQQRTLLDGVAVMPSELNDHLEGVLRSFPLPFVVLDDDIEGVSHDSVIINQKQGAESLMQHVVRVCGARRVIFVGGPETNFDTIARRDVCREALTRCGMSLALRDTYHLDYQFETAYVLAAREVAQWAGPGTVVFAANDEMAAGIISAAAAAGVAVPRELGVVGFDDTRIARMTRPALTTVHVPIDRMGAKAMELLCERLAEPDRPPVRISLDPELVVRESCGAPAPAR